MSFNWEVYRNLNPDLTRAGLKTREDFVRHYLTFGIRENRKGTPQSIKNFNWMLYRKSNPDLITAGLKTPYDFEKHYVTYGIKEGRRIDGSINIPQRRPQYNKPVTEQEIRAYFKGKRVAIIAPSPSVRYNPNGDEIDKYDIVVRVNKNWTHSPDLNRYIGTRVDVLYNCINEDPECGGVINYDYIKNKVKYIGVSIPIICDNNHRDKIFHNNQMERRYRVFVERNKNRVKHYIINKEMYNRYDNILKSRVNTGFMAILDILSYDIKELYIKGFTFFQDGYLSSYRGSVFGVNVNERTSAIEVIKSIRREGNHNIEREIELFKEIYRKNVNRIRLDERMKIILNIK